VIGPERDASYAFLDHMLRPDKDRVTPGNFEQAHGVLELLARRC
jgi:hypothetical protein